MDTFVMGISLMAFTMKSFNQTFWLKVFHPELLIDHNLIFLLGKHYDRFPNLPKVGEIKLKKIPILIFLSKISILEMESYMVFIIWEVREGVICLPFNLQIFETAERIIAESHCLIICHY